MIAGNILYYGFTTVLSLFATALLYFVYKFIVNPLWKIQFYKNQGLPSYFYPVLGMGKRGNEYAKKYKDSMSYARKLGQSEPDRRAEVANFGSRVSLILYDPKLIKEFYSKPLNYYEKVPVGKAISTMFGKGILFSEGNRWKSHRRLISSVFHFEFLKGNVPLIVHTTQEFFDQLGKTDMKNVDILNEVQKITGEVVGRTFFGENLNKHTLQGQPMTLRLADLMSQTNIQNRGIIFMFLVFAGFNAEFVPSFRAYLNELREFRSFCRKIIEDRKKDTTKGLDMLGMLLETQKSEKEEDRFTDDDLVDEFITFFIAGMDTTGHLVTMALYLLSKNPEYLEKVKKEVKEIYDKTSPATVDSLNTMDFTQAVLKETLRFYTPAPTIVPRLAQFDHDILDIKVKKGTSVRPGPLFNHWNDKYFENPDKFMPERWLDKKKDLDSYAYIPFSAGARNCIGQHLAMIEAKVILSEFVKRFDYKIVPENYELDMGFKFLYGPKQKITLDLTAKN